MSAATDIPITAGVPFDRRIRVQLPAGRSWWTDLADFEVLAQVRSARRQDAALQVDLTQFLTVTMDGDDEVVIDLVMTGADTRVLEGKGGAYDMLMTDAGIVDTRGLPPIQWGKVRVAPIVTAAAEEVTP